jgi:ketopantoate reductase
MEALLGECCHIAASEDQMIRPDVLQRIRALLTDTSSTLTASMLRDLERGMVTEADISSAIYYIASLSWLSSLRRYCGSRIYI